MRIDEGYTANVGKRYPVRSRSATRQTFTTRIPPSERSPYRASLGSKEVRPLVVPTAARLLATSQDKGSVARRDRPALRETFFLRRYPPLPPPPPDTTTSKSSISSPSFFTNNHTCNSNFEKKMCAESRAMVTPLGPREVRGFSVAPRLGILFCNFTSSRDQLSCER